MGITGIQDAPVSDTLERDYCSDADVEFMASGLDIDFTTVWDGGIVTADVRQMAALEIERATNRYFFQVRHSESYDGGFKYLIPNYLPILEVEECYYDDDTANTLLDDLKIKPFRIRMYYHFPPGLDNISLIYVAGYETCPQHIRWATAIYVTLRAVGMDPDWISMITSSGGASGAGERLTVGPVTMEEGGKGWDGLMSARFNQLCAQYITAIQREQDFRIKTTTREDRYKRMHEWLMEDQYPYGGRRYG